MQSPSAIPSAPSYFDMPSNDIVPQRSPTVLRPVSLTFSDLTLSDSGSPTQECDERDGYRDSEAARYLAQFHSSSYVSDLGASRRPRTNRASTGFESGLPSLTNTPASSVGTAASMASYRPLPPRHDPLGHFPAKSDDLVMPAYPITAPSSPAQLKKDSSLKSSASTLTSFRVAEGEDLSFDRRRPSWRRSGGSLKQSFSHEAIKAPPDNS